MSSLFSHFLGERSFKSRQNPRVDYFSGKKRLRRFKTAFFHLLLLSFVVDGLFTTPVYSPRRGHFVNSAFPNNKNLAQQRSLFMTNKFESKCLQKFYGSSKHEKEYYMKNDVLPRGAESPFLSALHAKNDTTNLFGYKLGESTEKQQSSFFLLR